MVNVIKKVLMGASGNNAGPVGGEYFELPDAADDRFSDVVASPYSNNVYAYYAPSRRIYRISRADYTYDGLDFDGDYINNQVSSQGRMVIDSNENVIVSGFHSFFGPTDANFVYSFPKELDHSVGENWAITIYDESNVYDQGAAGSIYGTIYDKTNNKIFHMMQVRDSGGADLGVYGINVSTGANQDTPDEINGTRPTGVSPTAFKTSTGGSQDQILILESNAGTDTDVHVISSTGHAHNERNSYTYTIGGTSVTNVIGRGWVVDTINPEVGDSTTKHFIGLGMDDGTSKYATIVVADRTTDNVELAKHFSFSGYVANSNTDENAPVLAVIGGFVYAGFRKGTNASGDDSMVIAKLDPDNLEPKWAYRLDFATTPSDADIYDDDGANIIRITEAFEEGYICFGTKSLAMIVGSGGLREGTYGDITVTKTTATLGDVVASESAQSVSSTPITYTDKGNVVNPSAFDVSSATPLTQQDFD